MSRHPSKDLSKPPSRANVSPMVHSNRRIPCRGVRDPRSRRGASVMVGLTKSDRAAAREMAAALKAEIPIIRELSALKSQAESLAIDGKLEEAHAKYRELQEHSVGRTIKDSLFWGRARGGAKVDQDPHLHASARSCRRRANPPGASHAQAGHGHDECPPTTPGIGRALAMADCAERVFRLLPQKLQLAEQSRSRRPKLRVRRPQSRLTQKTAPAAQRHRAFGACNVNGPRPKQMNRRHPRARLRCRPL